MRDTNERTAVLLDAHPLWLDAVENVVRTTGVGLVWKTTRPKEALALVQQHRPDLFITETDVPDGDLDGFTCLRLACERAPATKGIVLSARPDEEAVELAFVAGAVAYVIKTASSEDLASAIREAFDRPVYFAARPRPTTSGGQPREVDSILTRREREILRLVSEGHSNAAVARMLWVTEQTVKFHLSNTYRKLNVSNRTEASRWAQLHGLLSTDGRADMGPENHRAGVTAFPRRSKANRTGTDGRDVEYPLEARGVAQPG